MNKSQAFVDRTKAIVFTGLVAGADLVKTWMIGQVQSNELVSVIFWAAYVLVLYLSVELLQVSISAAITHSPTLRKLTDREGYVEGQWVDVVFTSAGGWTGGLVNIEMRDGELHVSGESFSGTGQRIGTFRSLVASLEKTTLRYSFAKLDHGSTQLISPGYGEYHFQLEKRLPERFDGFFFKEGSSDKFHIFGRRVRKGELDALASDARKGEFVKAVVEEYKASAHTTVA